MHLRSNLFLAIVLAALTPFGADAASCSGRAPRPSSRTRKLVPLHVSVVDKNGKLVTNLPQSAFKVYENNVEQPSRFSTAKTSRCRWGSSSITAAACAKNGRKWRPRRWSWLRRRTRRTRFSSSISTMWLIWMQPFTNNIKKLEQVLDKIDSRGGTAMRDAISMSIDYAKEKGKKEQKSPAGDYRRQRQHQQQNAGAVGAQGPAKRSADLLRSAC